MICKLVAVAFVSFRQLVLFLDLHTALNNARILMMW